MSIQFLLDKKQSGISEKTTISCFKVNTIKYSIEVNRQSLKSNRIHAFAYHSTVLYQWPRLIQREHNVYKNGRMDFELKTKTKSFFLNRGLVSFV